MKIVYAEAYLEKAEKIEAILSKFSLTGEILNDGSRNTIKIFDLDGRKVNVKSFKIPNLINKIAYRFFRKSKAERSFSYAQYLLSRKIGTPFPVAYAEERNWLTFGRSYYICDQLPYDFTFRYLIEHPEYPNFEEVLRAFTRFTYDLHEKNVEFLDHSPGNTLIQIHNQEYQFFLVDLNRMNFRRLNFEDRMKNFSRLTPKREMIEIMANEYAKITAWNEQKVFETMWRFTEEFQHKFYRKKRLKKRLKFWKK